jgi:hypothetical protein
MLTATSGGSKTPKFQRTHGPLHQIFDMIQQPDCTSTQVRPFNRSVDIKVTEQSPG